MRRSLPPRLPVAVVARWAALAIAVVAPLAGAPSAAAADPSPKVNEFGIPVDTSGDLLLPAILVLVVVSAGLIAAAVIALRLRRRAETLSRPGDVIAWWRCAACGALNAADRDACFSCHASRPPTEPPASPTDPGATPLPG